jgi:hypothetical protein
MSGRSIIAPRNRNIEVSSEYAKSLMVLGYLSVKD